MKIIINTPDINEIGGVANHYKGLKKYWKYDVKYNTIGSRRKIPGIIYLPTDILKFIFKILYFKPDLIVLNPSLLNNAFKRDSLFLIIAAFFKIETIVFFHGWDKKFELEINKKQNYFLKFYKKANGFIVLSNDFKDNMIRWGVLVPIHISTTKVEDDLIKEFDISKKVYNRNILFLSRVIEEKGIFIAINTFELISKNYNDVQLTIVGDGENLNDAMDIVKTKKLKNVKFTGALRGEELINEFKNSDIYLFPTYYGEGLPTSLLEAMAFGLPIITRPVGGIADFFISEKMGYSLNSKSEIDFAEKIEELIINPNKIAEFGKFNYSFAVKNFMASEVAKKLEDIFSNYNENEQ